MNPIQKQWLKILKPLAYLINERLAKRAGWLQLKSLNLQLTK